MNIDLSDRRILVTGSSTGTGTGIGAAVALAYAEAGASVAVHCNASREQAEAVVALIRSGGGTAHLVGGDIARSTEAARVVDAAAAGRGNIIDTNSIAARNGGGPGALLQWAGAEVSERDESVGFGSRARR